MNRAATSQSRGRVFGRGLAATASLALCIGGAGLMLQGATIPLEAKIGQQRLSQEFDRTLAANTASPVEGAGGLPSPQPASARGRANPQPIRVPAKPILATGAPVARLTVKRLDISHIVLAGDATDEQLDEGPAMIKPGGSASPVTVLAAHRDTHFLFIRDLRPGDEVTLRSVTGRIERYRVTRFETVRWDAFTYPLDPATPLLALATCWPFGGTEYGGPWRRVAWAERIG